MKAVTDPTTKWVGAGWLAILAGCGHPVADHPDASAAPYAQSSVFGEVGDYDEHTGAYVRAFPASTLAHVDDPLTTSRLGGLEVTGIRSVNVERMADDPLWTKAATSADVGTLVAAFITDPPGPGQAPAGKRPGACPASWCDDGDLGTMDECLADDTTADGFVCSFRYDPTAEGAPCRHRRYCCPDGRTHETCPDTGDACPTWWCDDANACTTDRCTANGKRCNHVPTQCDDGNACTIDTCDPLLGCRHRIGNDAIPCYTGPAQTAGIGRCRPGTRRCESGTEEACRDQILPAPEVCNGLDDDCDGEVDEADALGCIQLFRDEDGDGFGQRGDTRCLCAAAAPYQARLPGDCNDGARAIRPGAIEACGDAIDSNCDGTIDEHCSD